MAFVTEQTLFIHVQKTGGMTVREILYQLRPMGRESGDSEAERHFGLPELLAAHPGIETGRLSFGFVRDPVRWLKSRWAFAVMTGLMTHARHSKAAATNWMASCWADSFETFAEKYLERYPGIATQTMFRMLGLWSDRPVTRIGRTESLLSDLRAIIREAGETIDDRAFETAPRRNAAEKRILDGVACSRALEQRIRAAEPLLCARFRY